jgi:molecular chaperone DnaK
MLKDTGDKISSSDKAAIEQAMEAVKKAAEGTDAAELQRALDQLTREQHKAAETLYRSQAQQPPSAGSGQGAGGDGGAAAGGEAPKGDVIDAEVVDEGKPQ